MERNEALKLLVTSGYCCGFHAESGANQPLTFVDLAGAPSGFSHYVYWKKQHLAKVGVA